MRASYRPLAPALERDLPGIWSVTRSSGTFTSMDDLERYWRDAPWRVQVSDSGIALLGRWRQHLPLLAIKGLWCAERHIPPAMEQLLGVATAQGLEDLVTPVTPEHRVAPYLEAGMRIVHTGITMRLEHPGGGEPVLPAGVEFRLAVPGDLEVLMAVDLQCFSDFWRYDEALLRPYIATDRAVVASVDGEVIGYTLSTVDRGEGMLGRLAVVPRHRRCGVGGALVADVLDYQHRSGARAVALYTQEENAASRALYERAGFRVVGVRQHFLTFGERVVG